jgi:hypothetical protein
VFKKARHGSLSWATRVQFTQSQFCFSKLRFNTILPSTPTSSKLSLPSKVSDQNFVWLSHLSYVCYIPNHVTLLYLITLIIFSEKYKLWSSSLCNFLLSSINSTPPLTSRDSSVGIALGYGLDDRDYRVRFPAGAGNFSLHHRVQNGSGAYPDSYSMGIRCFFPGG